MFKYMSRENVAMPAFAVLERPFILNGALFGNISKLSIRTGRAKCGK
jgi:hypothetical protein